MTEKTQDAMALAISDALRDAEAERGLHDTTGDRRQHTNYAAGKIAAKVVYDGGWVGESDSGRLVAAANERATMASRRADEAERRLIYTERERDQIAVKLNWACERLASAQTERSECEKICNELRGMLGDAKDRADRAETGNSQLTADLSAAREYAETLALELERQRGLEIIGPQEWMAADPAPAFGADEPADEVAAHPLYPVFVGAINQCMHGEGERHGGNATYFMFQPWRELARIHGRGFLTGRAEQKLAEAARQGLVGAPFEHRVLGAIAYLGMAILWDREMDAEGGAE